MSRIIGRPVLQQSVAVNAIYAAPSTSDEQWVSTTCHHGCVPDCCRQCGIEENMEGLLNEFYPNRLTVEDLLDQDFHLAPEMQHIACWGC
jgi:hypothetical protein